MRVVLIFSTHIKKVNECNSQHVKLALYQNSTAIEDIWEVKSHVVVSETGSESFDKFLNLLGDSITLQGWAGYRGGLDTKSKRAHVCWITLRSHNFNVKDGEFAIVPLLMFLSLLPADDTTGIKSIYTVYQGHELMFHVSTMLPYSKENKQQVGVCLHMHFCPVLQSLLLATLKGWQCHHYGPEWTTRYIDMIFGTDIPTPRK